MIRKLFYASAAGWPIRTHQYWARGEDDPTQVSVTFSGQIETFARDIGAELVIVTANPDGERLTDSSVTIEHWRKDTGSGIHYYLAELRHARRLVRRARDFDADVALLDSGTIPYFMMTLFRAAGIRVVPVLHNTLWPAGFPPKSRAKRMLQRLDAWFWRTVPSAIVAVSPEIERQLRGLAHRPAAPVFQTRAHFRRAHFVSIFTPDLKAKPFEIVFVGRMVAGKGALDIPRMAAWIEERAPDCVHWTLCGDGDALDEVRTLVRDLGLEHAVEVRGWTAPAELEEVYARSHAAIVPTRSSFNEGLAMSAVEPVLCGRPVVTNRVVPALELVRPAAIEAAVDSVEDHAAAVLRLATDSALYARLRAACVPLGEQFLDPDRALTATLHRVANYLAETTTTSPVAP